MKAKAAITYLTGNGDAVTATSRITVILASAAIVAAAILSYTALYDLFLAIGLFGWWLALLFPILFDVVEVAAAVDVLNAKLQGQDARYSWRLVILFTALGIIANVAHAAHAWHLGRIDTAQMALAIGATSLFPLSVAMVTHLLKLSITRSLDRRRLVTTLDELTQKIDRARAEKVNIESDVEAIKEDAGLWFDLSRFIGRDTEKGSSDWRELRELVWERDGKQCKACERDLSDGSYHCHHIVPAAVGGKGEPVNLVTVCEPCHSKIHGKNAALPIEKAKDVGSLSTANGARRSKIDQRREKVLTLSELDLTQKEIADRLDVSRATIKRDLKALNGRARGVTQ